MIRYEILVQKPRLFRSLTGLDAEELDRLLQKFIPCWQEQEYQRLDRLERQRAIGGGRKYRLPRPDRLLRTLCCLRLYRNTEALGFFFGVDKSTASRNVRRALKGLRLLGEETLGWPEPPRRSEGKSVEEALEECPDLTAIVDATERPAATAAA